MMVICTPATGQIPGTPSAYSHDARAVLRHLHGIAQRDCTSSMPKPMGARTTAAPRAHFELLLKKEGLNIQFDGEFLYGKHQLYKPGADNKPVPDQAVNYVRVDAAN